MKRKSRIISLLLMLFVCSFSAIQKTSAQVSVSFQLFYDDLSPYGNWVNNNDYGYVWVPDVEQGFTPYATNGHWVFTDQGWTWVSNYSWGWAPFHYGRWFYENYYGWIWVPDNEWGPGWVTWRRSDEYYGWAPLGPGISLDFGYSSGYNLPYDRWTFVRDRDFGSTNITNYYINNSNNVTIINNTTVINNTRTDRIRNVRFNAGPDRNEVEQRGGKKIGLVTINESNRPGQQLLDNKLEIYRPQVQKNNSISQKPVPARVIEMKDVKTREQRTAENPNLRNEQQRQQQVNDQQKQQKQQQINDQQKQQQRQQQINDQQKQQQKQQQINNQQKQQRRQQQVNDQQRQQQRQQQVNDQQKQQQKQQQINDQQKQQRQQQVNDQQRQQQRQLPQKQPQKQPPLQQPQQQQRKVQPEKQQPQKNPVIPPNKKGGG